LKVGVFAHPKRFTAKAKAKDVSKEFKIENDEATLSYRVGQVVDHKAVEQHLQKWTGQKHPKALI